jgi:hypothetical protein
MLSIRGAVESALGIGVHFEPIAAMGLSNSSEIGGPGRRNPATYVDLLLVQTGNNDVERLASISAHIISRRFGAELNKGLDAKGAWSKILLDTAGDKCEVLAYDPVVNFLFLRCPEKEMMWFVQSF